MKRLLVVASLALAALLLPQAARAQTATSTLHVTASVIPGCTIDPATLAFGNYDPGSGTDGVGSAALTIRCTLGSDFYVEFGPHGARQMTNGAAGTLGYELYRDAAHTIVWDATDTTETPADQPGLGFQAYGATVYGLIPASQSAPPGLYSADVTMTVHF